MSDATGALESYFAFITDKQQVVTWKLDLKHYQDGESGIDEWWQIAEDHFHIALQYTSQTVGVVIASSAGMHLAGKNGKPHIHFHFVVDAPFVSITDSAKSMRKTRWLKDRENQDVILMKQMTVAYSPFDTGKPKWACLSYPLKEEHRGSGMMYRVVLPNQAYIVMPVEIVDLLEQVGTSIYNVALAIRERNEKCEKRKEDNLQDLYEFALAKRGCFTTFREMQEYFEDVYIGKLVEAGIHELPDVVNFNRNLKKVGRMLRLFKYMDDSSAK